MRKDLSILQPLPLPIGAAGSTVTDKFFNARITRATDGNTYKNFSLMTSDAALANLWNKGGSLLFITTTGGQKLILDTTTFKINPFSFSGPLCWSRVNSNVIYGIDGLKIVKITFKKLLGIWSYNKQTVVTDFTAVLPKGYLPKWHSAFLVSEGDQSFAFGVSEGIQDTGFFACSYANKKQTVLNTSTSTKSFLLHEVYQTINPEFVVLAPTNSSAPAVTSPLIWDLALNEVTETNTSGHFALGAATFAAGGPGAGQWASLPYDDPSNKTLIVAKGSLPAAAGQQFREDSHGSWNNAVADTEPFYVSTGGPSYGQAIPYPTAWYNEILAYNHDGTVSRICQTRCTCASKYFIGQNAITVISQEGHKAVFCSDWMNTLGTDINGNPRVDVFIVAIQEEK